MIGTSDTTTMDVIGVEGVRRLVLGLCKMQQYHLLT